MSFRVYKIGLNIIEHTTSNAKYQRGRLELLLFYFRKKVVLFAFFSFCFFSRYLIFLLKLLMHFKQFKKKLNKMEIDVII